MLVCGKEEKAGQGERGRRVSIIRRGKSDRRTEKRRGRTAQPISTHSSEVDQIQLSHISPHCGREEGQWKTEEEEEKEEKVVLVIGPGWPYLRNIKVPLLLRYPDQTYLYSYKQIRNFGEGTFQRLIMGS